MAALVAAFTAHCSRVTVTFWPGSRTSTTSEVAGVSRLKETLRVRKAADTLEVLAAASLRSPAPTEAQVGAAPALAARTHWVEQAPLPAALTMRRSCPAATVPAVAPVLTVRWPVETASGAA